MATYISIRDVQHVESTTTYKQANGAYVRALKIKTADGPIEITLFSHEDTDSLAIHRNLDKY